MKRRNLFLLYSPLIKGVRGLFLSTAYCLLFTVFLWGCGAGGGSAPPGSTITIDPSSLSATIVGDTIYPFTVYVEDDKGNPINHAEVWISGSFAAPRTPARYQFCRQSDGVDPVNSSFSAETDEFGTYTFSIIVPAIVDGATNSFKDNIEVRSGSAYVSASISIN